ncbi:radical SAM protein [bacterium]|nr:radical SAM protein [bacterium]
MKSAIDVQSKLFQETVLAHLEKTDFTESKSSAPMIVELDPTAACDLACPGCISEDIIAIGGRFSNERLLSLGQEMIDAGVRGVILIGGGEPLAHPKIGDLITLLGEAQVAIGITTNGTFIDRYLSQIREYSSWTRISFDAATKSTFDTLRPSKNRMSKYWKIITNMRMLGADRRGLLGFSFLIQTPADGSEVISNVHEIYAAALLAKDIGCDYFEVKPSYQWRDDVPHALMKHGSDLMTQAKEQVEWARELQDDSFSVYEAINLQASLAGVDEPQVKNYTRCPAAELRTLITPKGGFICPYWRGKSGMWLGDLNTNSFSDIWAGPQRKAVMDSVNPAETCNFHCLRHGSNQSILDLKVKLSAKEKIEAVSDYDPFI